jgi:translation initiation factor 2 subunit 1
VRLRCTRVTKRLRCISMQTVVAVQGKLTVKAEARVVSTQDDRLLNEQLESLAKANAEVDGDADSEAEEDTGMGDVDLSGPAITA